MGQNHGGGSGHPDGGKAERNTLSNAKGMTARISNFGAAITAMLAPDRDGKFINVVRGYVITEFCFLLAK